MCDWDVIVADIADEELWWAPGTQMGYHAWSFGYLVGEVVRRADGRRISEVLAQDIAGPLGVDHELFFGMPADEQHRLAVLQDVPSDPAAFADMPADLPMFRAGPMALMPTAALGNDPRMLGADIPAGAKISARALARMYAALLGEVDGIRLLTPAQLDLATADQYSGRDTVFGNSATWGLGYALGSMTAPDAHEVFGMGGAGGSWAGADRRTGISVAITKNLLTQDFSTSTQIMDLVLEPARDR